ncbi:MAG: glutathione S-transferase [Gammaproteobacteria bacterium]|nr:glutathione S-transferase [Gammaproteobacteria bacterium]
MQDLILHHYDVSPFAQKIRSIFGYCGLAWGSVLSPPMPPRPNLDPLAGGYRKIPVLQRGADIFCDTRIITAELALLTGKPELDRNQCSVEIQGFVDTVDVSVFFASAGSAEPLKALGAMVLRFGPIATLRFIKDRVAMARGAKIPMPTGAKAQKILKPHYGELEERLSSQAFLFGEQPTIADFSAYHVAWLAMLTGAKPIQKNATHTRDWYQRITAFGDGEREELKPQQAFQAAKDHEPRALPKNSDNSGQIGNAVRIAPTDYARDAVQGTLVADTKERWILRRDTEDFGALHVHFPKQGFAVSEA